MRGARVFLACFVSAFCLTAAGTAGAYHTQFVAQNCNWAAPTPTSYITRDGSLTVALRARYEGYQWGGGCWNDNDTDDSPGDPPEDPNTGGEGGDCSGFTFKVWRESMNEADAGFYQWGMLRHEHGPYVAREFKGGDGAPNIIAPKSGLYKMDAFASIGHIAMIYVRNADGTDTTIEAKGERYGTNVWTRAYRGADNYGGVRRAGWSD